MLRCAFVVTLLLLAGCEQAPPSPAKAPIATIREAGYYPPVLNLEIDFGQSRSPELLTQVGREVLQIGKSMIAGKPPVQGQIDAINFVVLGGEGADKTIGRKIARFSFPAQELRQIANIGGDGDTVLDAAREVGTWTPNNRDIIDGYCADRSASTFCDAAK